MSSNRIQLHALVNPATLKRIKQLVDKNDPAYQSEGRVIDTVVKAFKKSK